MNSNQQIAINTSNDSTIDSNIVYDIPEDNLIKSNDNKHKYEISIKLLSTSYLHDFCKSYIDHLNDNHIYDYNQKFWISWVYMNRSYQTNEFTIYSGIDRAIDQIVVTCSSIDSLISYFNSIVSTLKIFLCTVDDKIIGRAEISFDLLKSNTNDLNDAYMPMKSFVLESLIDELETIQSTITISIEVVCIDDNEPIMKSPIKESIEELPNDINEEEYQSKRYRLSIDIKSIGGLKRPAYAGIHFKYPYLGSNAVIRTHPLWALANTETRIDNAKACYDFSMNRLQIKETLDKYPLIVQVTSRSHLGQDTLGETTVNITKILDSKPMSFRCSISGRIFKTIQEYQAYRYSMITLHAAGKIELIPHKQPIAIYALDSYYNIKANIDKNNHLISTVEGSKLHIVILLEDLGVISNQLGINVKPGYKMQSGGLYEINEGDKDNNINKDSDSDFLNRNDLTEYEKIHLNKLINEFENWRKNIEIDFIESLHKKEILLREKLDNELVIKLDNKSNELLNKQNELLQLEIKLKNNLNEIDKIKNSLVIKENIINNKLVEKTNELILLSNRIKLDYQIKLNNEINKNKNLTNQINLLNQSIDKNNKKYNYLENEYENYRNTIKNTSEYILKEENFKLKIKINELKYLLENKSKDILNVIIEKDYYKSQMNRLAVGLKREREKNSIIARQDIEQLRLEFLAREERYVLDGDRDELRNIRNELSTLKYNLDKNNNITPSNNHYTNDNKTNDNIDLTSSEQKTSSPTTSIPNFSHITTIRQQIDELLATGLYDPDDEVIKELVNALHKAELDNNYHD